MRILFDFQDTIGGAPRSHLEHAKLMAANGHTVLAVISETDSAFFFDGVDCKVTYLPRFYTRRPIRSLISVFRYVKLVRQERVEAICANRGVNSQFLGLVSDLCRIPIVNAQPGRMVLPHAIRAHLDKHYIVYSDENAAAFSAAGFPDTNVFVVRNRIPCLSTPVGVQTTHNDRRIITVTGNIKEDTLKGILWLLELLEKNIDRVRRKMKVYIAGQVLPQSAADSTRFYHVLESVKRSVEPWCVVEYLGWVHDIAALHAKSDICIGKGRSVIQPAMMGKVSFVLSDAGVLYRCKKETFEKLGYYNFSGRGWIEDRDLAIREFMDVLGDDNALSRYKQDALELSSTIQREYATQGGKDKLENIFQIAKEAQEGSYGVLNAIKRFLRIYYYAVLKEFRCTQGSVPSGGG